MTHAFDQSSFTSVKNVFFLLISPIKAFAFFLAMISPSLQSLQIVTLSSRQWEETQ